MDSSFTMSSFGLNRVEQFRREYDCAALKKCTIQGADAYSRIFQFTVYLQKTLTMVEVGPDEMVTAMQMFIVTESNLYLPFYYDKYPVEIQ